MPLRTHHRWRLGALLLLSVAGSAGASPTPGTRTSISLGDSLDLDVVWVPPGTFRMGTSPDDDPAREIWYVPPVEVTLTRGVWMGRTEVTVDTWCRVLGAPLPDGDPALPVRGVSADEVDAFLSRANDLAPDGVRLRLPTEAEWEHAARAGSDRSVVADIAEVGWTRADGIDGPRPVATKRANRWGLHDVFGNVNELCADWYASFPDGPLVDPTGPPAGELRVVRGGSFTGRVRHANPSDRGRVPPDEGRPWVGFRVVVEREDPVSEGDARSP